MKIVLSLEDRKSAYRRYVEYLMDIADDEEMEVNLPAYTAGEVTVEIVKKPPQEQPQE